MSALAYCPPEDLARGACRTLGVCWGHECVGFADCPCQRCRHLRLTHTESHPNHSHVSDESYCGVCRTQEHERNYSTNCYWDAQHRGNGVGHSFVQLGDLTIY